MKTVFLIKKDSEFLWQIKSIVPGSFRTGIQWGSKYSQHVREFKTFDEASKMLDSLPVHMFMGAPYFEIVKFLKK